MKPDVLNFFSERWLRTRLIVGLRLVDLQVWEIALVVKLPEADVERALKARGRIGKRGGYWISRAQHKSLRLNWYIPRSIGPRQLTRQGCPYACAEVLGNALPHISAARGLEPFDLNMPWPPTTYKRPTNYSAPKLALRVGFARQEAISVMRARLR